MLSRRKLLAGTAAATICACAKAAAFPLFLGGAGSTFVTTLVQQRPIQNFAVGSTPTGFYKEFGAWFKQGDVPSGSIVEWRLGDGVTVIASQADNRVTYADGSLKGASFTIKYPNSLAVSGTDTLKGYAKSGSWNNSSWTTSSAITARDLRMEITISGTTYTLSANNEVTRGTNIQQIRSGPKNATWRVWGEFRNGTGINATPQGEVWGILYLTFFDDGTYAAWGTIQPNRLSDANGTTVGSVSVSDYKLKDYVGPTTLFDYSTAFTMYVGTPVYCCNTDGLHPYTGTSVDKCVIGFPVFTLADSTTTGLYDSKCVWWYHSTATQIADMPSQINYGTTATYIPNSVADCGNPNQTGGNPWIGALTIWDVFAMLLGDWTTLRADRVNAFAEAVNQVSFLDPTTSYPGNFKNKSYTGLPASTLNYGWGQGGSFTLNGGQAPPTWSDPPWNGSHAPLYAYYQYLATGQEPWLDMLHEQTIGFLGAQNPGTGVNYSRNPTINGTTYHGTYQANLQTRAIGWNIRNADNTEWVTPDAHPMKPYLGDVVADQFPLMANYVQAPNNPAGAATLGVFDGGEDGNGINSPWMHDQLTQSYAMAIRRGRITASDGFVTFHIIPWCFGRSVNGCANAACCYNMGLFTGQTPGASYPTDWTNIWVGSNGVPLDYKLITPHGVSCPASGVDSAQPYQAGYTYPLLFQIAAVCGQIAGISTASTCVTYMAAVETSAAQTEAQWAGWPHGRIRLPS